MILMNQIIKACFWKEEVKTELRGHKKTWERECVLTTQNSFPYRFINTWNKFKEVVEAKSVQNFKEKLDRYRYTARTTWVYLRPCTLQLGKDTHVYAQDQTNIKGKASPKNGMQIKNWIQSKCCCPLDLKFISLYIRAPFQKWMVHLRVAYNHHGSWACGGLQKWV